MRLPDSASAPFVGYDPSGKVFAVMYQDHNVDYIRMYDTGNTTIGPFTTFPFEPQTVAAFLAPLGLSGLFGAAANTEALARATWTSLSFSPDGDYILVRARMRLLNLVSVGWFVVWSAQEALRIRPSCSNYSSKPFIHLFICSFIQ